MNKAIFLDRDGVINKLIPDVYVNHWDQFEFIPEALEGLKLLADTDYKIFVVSNQGGIGEGYADQEEVHMIFERMCGNVAIEPGTEPYQNIRGHGGRIDEFLFCPHKLDAGCCCRKPKPGMIYDLALRWEVDLSASWMIGDMDSDMEAGNSAGIMSLIHIVPNYTVEQFTYAAIAKSIVKVGVFVVHDLLEAAKLIIHKDEHIFDSSDHPEPEFGWLNIMMDDLVHSIREDKC